MSFLVDRLTFEPLERIEFGFVLLPDDDTLDQLYKMSQYTYHLLQDIETHAIPVEWGSYVNHALRIPHLSVGHYGVLACELPALKEIVQEVAGKAPIIVQKMQSSLSVQDDYIFFDSMECFSSVNHHIRDVYIALRVFYMDRIHTKFQKAHVLSAKKYFANDPEELVLINECFQHWGTPEYDRMRPHFTMHYHPPFVVEKMKQRLAWDAELTKQLASLSIITLTRLGIVQVDTFGNPVENGLLCACPLMG